VSERVRLVEPWAPLVAAALVLLDSLFDPPVPIGVLCLIMVLTICAGRLAAVWRTGERERWQAVKLTLAVTIVALAVISLNSTAWTQDSVP
jgi:hypothetical protein